MSAFICNNSHVTALAVYVARNRIGGQTDARKVGELLHAENVESVNHRYAEATPPRFELCEWAAFQEFSPVQIGKAAFCLMYQSCEHPGWETSKAYALLMDVATRCIGPDLLTECQPVYADAQWEISPPAATRLPSPAEVIANPTAYLPDLVASNDNDQGNER